MKKIYSLLFIVLLFTGFKTNAQSSANYTFATNNTGSLALDLNSNTVDMSTGTTQISGVSVDQGVNASAINIGFDFWLMGNRYTQFNVTTNGLVSLSSTGTSASGSAYAVSGGTVTTPIISAFAADIATGTLGKTHYKTVGTAPNRCLVIEFKNMALLWTSSYNNDGTFQVRLYESTGVIEFVYGSMSITSTGSASDATVGIGFATNTTTNNLAWITSSTNTNSYSASFTDNPVYPTGAIANLNSAADGSRRVYTFTPPVPTAAPTGLNFTSVGSTSMTLNWTDNAANETGYAIFRSTDGVNYTLVSQTAANAVSSPQSGLAVSTNYFWKVYAYTEGAISTSLDGNQATTAPGNYVTNGTGGGLWSQTSTWATGIVPSAGDNATIKDGDVVTIDVAAAALNLTVGEGTSGTLQYESGTARTLTVSGNVTIANGGSFKTAATGTVTTHVLSVAGNLTNNGVLDFSTNSNTAGGNITFTTASNATFGGTGTTTDIRTLTINKGASNVNILELNPTNFTVQGTSVDGTPMAFLTLTNGTLKVSGTFTLAARLFTVAAYTIGANAGLWLNNSNFTVSGQNGSPVNAGLLRLTQGTYNIGTSTGNSMTTTAGAVFTIEGGTMNVTGRLSATNAITYTQTGGTVNVSTIGNASSQSGGFNMGTNSIVFNMSGGSIVVVQRNTNGTAANRVDYVNVATTHNITGGTLQIGSGATTTNFDFRVYGYTPSMVLDNTTNNKTIAMSSIFNLLIVNGSLTLNSGTTFTGATSAQAGEVDILGGAFNINTGASFICNGSFIYHAGTNFVNNGTFNGTATGSVIYWAGTTPQTYSGTGTNTAPLLSMSVDNASGVTFDPAITSFIVNRINLFTGSITNSNKLTLGNGGSTSAIIQIGNATTPPTAAGTFDQPMTFNPGTGGISINYMRTTAARSTGPEIPATRLITSLTVDENDLTHPLTITGGDITVSGTYAQTNGNIITGSNTLVSGISVAAPGTFTYTSGIIAGNFKRWITATTTNWVFPVGTVTDKKNASINFTTAPTTGGSLTARWSSVSPDFPNAAPLVEGALIVSKVQKQGSWFIDAADGLAGGAYTGTFTANGANNIADFTKTVLIKRPSAGGDWILDGTHVTTTGSNTAPVLSRTGMAGFSEFAIGGDNSSVLPIGIVYFRGTKQNHVHNLTWKVNCTNSSKATMTLERSADGRNFTPINTITANAVRCLDAFYYDDVNPLPGINYYRLKSVDDNGNVTYSSIVTLLNKEKGFEIVNISPNPTVNGQFKLNVTTTQQTKMDVIITDMAGRVVAKKAITLINGFNAIDMNVSNLASGTYQLFGNTAEGKTTTLSFVKQ